MPLSNLNHDQPILIEHSFCSTESEEQITKLPVKIPPNYDNETTGIFYKAALILNNVLKDILLLRCKRPSTAEDFNKVILKKLFKYYCSIF